MDRGLASLGPVEGKPDCAPGPGPVVLRGPARLRASNHPSWPQRHAEICTYPGWAPWTLATSCVCHGSRRALPKNWEGRSVETYSLLDVEVEALIDGIWIRCRAHETRRRDHGQLTRVSWEDPDRDQRVVREAWLENSRLRAIHSDK